MTKEEIFDKRVGSYFRKLSPQTIKDVDKAMDEFAQQQSIDFCNYVFQEVWNMNSMSPSPFVSNEQIYQNFLEHQNKQK